MNAKELYVHINKNIKESSMFKESEQHQYWRSLLDNELELWKTEKSYSHVISSLCPKDSKGMVVNDFMIFLQEYCYDKSHEGYKMHPIKFALDGEEHVCLELEQAKYDFFRNS
jgi:hypothetical protein